MKDREPTEPLGKESTRSQASSELASENSPLDDAPWKSLQRTGPSEEKSVEVSDSSGPQTPEQPHPSDAENPYSEPVPRVTDLESSGNDSGAQTDKRELANYSLRNTSDNDAYQKFRNRWIMLRTYTQLLLFFVILGACLGCYFNETIAPFKGDFELVCYKQPEACKGPAQSIWHTFEKEICSPANEQDFCGEEVEEMWKRYEHAVWGNRDENLKKLHMRMIWKRYEPSTTMWIAPQEWPDTLQELWDELQIADWPARVHQTCYTIQRFNYQLGREESLQEKWAITQKFLTIIATAFALELCLNLPMFFDAWTLAVGNLICLCLSFIVYLLPLETQYPKSIAVAAAATHILAISLIGHALNLYVSDYEI